LGQGSGDETSGGKTDSPVVAGGTEGGGTGGGALEQLKNSVGDKTDLVEASTKALGEQAKQKVEGTANQLTSAAKDLSANLGAALDSSFDVSKLKEAVGALNVEKLKGLADQFLRTIQKQDGVVQGLKDQLGKLAQNPGEIKAKLDAAMAQLGGLKEKFQLVVAKLKDHGIDVSKYLGGS